MIVNKHTHTQQKKKILKMKNFNFENIEKKNFFESHEKKIKFKTLSPSI